jgi:hypothetical protein
MSPEQRSAGVGERSTTDSRAGRGQNPTGAATVGTERELSLPALRIDPEKVAEKVYQLMRRDLMLEKERRGGEENA